MSRYFIYCRKSSESEDRQVLSIESQRRELNKIYIEKEGFDIVEILEEAFSAKSPGRSVFDTMMKRIEKGEADGIIAWHPDRLARNSVDGGKIIYLLDTGKIKDLKFPTYNFENTSQGKFMLNIIFGQSKYYVDSLSENVKRGNRTKLEKGWWPGRPPIGYLNNKSQNIITKDSARFILIRKMWRLMLTGNHTPPKILKIANNEWGLRSRKFKKIGGGPLCLSAIYKIFSNPFYCGLMLRNGEIYQGKHEPMITVEEFDRVQMILGRKGKPRPKSHSFAFTGLIRCQECGGFITAEEKINKYNSRYIYYHCTKRKKGHTCTQPSIRLEELERQIIEYLVHISIPERFAEWIIRYLRKIHERELSSQKDIEKSLEKAHLQSQKNLDNLIKMRYRGLLSDKEFLKEKRQLVKEQVILEEKMHELHNHDKCLMLSEQFLRFTSRVKKRFEEGSPEIKRAIIKTIGSNFYLKDKKLIIEAEKPFLIVEKRLNKIRSEKRRLELPRNGLVEPQISLAFAQFPQWQALGYDVRTFFLNYSNSKDIIPNFSIFSLLPGN